MANLTVERMRTRAVRTSHLFVNSPLFVIFYDCFVSVAACHDRLLSGIKVTLRENGTVVIQFKEK
jgi:BarA-like signal transduction histidine kinase